MSSHTARALGVLAAVVSLLGASGASAQAATIGSGSSASRANFSGTYNGQIDQRLPKAYTGHIHFVVSHGKITGLRFTAGALCGVIWVVVKDHKLPTFPLKVKSNGAFSYKGTVAGRLLRLRGTLRGNRAHGTFFQAFAWGQSTCTMGQPAAFTATR